MAGTSDLALLRDAKPCLRRQSAATHCAKHISLTWSGTSLLLMSCFGLLVSVGNETEIDVSGASLFILGLSYVRFSFAPQHLLRSLCSTQSLLRHSSYIVIPVILSTVTAVTHWQIIPRHRCIWSPSRHEVCTVLSSITCLRLHILTSMHTHVIVTRASC